MRLGDDGEPMRAGLINHGRQDRMIGGVRAAVIGRVVQEGVARTQIGMEPLHRSRHLVGAR
jgi:hypothetical protein